MKGVDGKPLKIVQKVAAHDYKTFGMCLLQDENGEDVALLKKNHIHDGAESVTEAILHKWLTSDAPTRTYQHLIECLRQSELGALAELIANTCTIVGQGMFAIIIACMIECFVTDFPTAPQATEPVTITQDCSSVQLPVLTVLQATTAQNSVYLPPSDSLTATQRTKQAIQNSFSFNSYGSYLRGLYTSMSQSHTSQHWSHLQRCEFVQLAMIGSEGQRRGDREEEMVRLAQQGRIETIMSYKKPINLETLFQLQVPQKQPLVVLPPPPPNPRVLLVEGAPGGGKSTLALHFCNQWTQYASFIDRFKVVVLVYLRDQAVQNATTLADILPARTLEMSQIFASQIQDCDGNMVLFIFDGWDEFPSHLQKNSLVSTIIRQPHKLFLHQSTVLITSRPVSSENLLKIADRRVEILGFTQHQISEYIEKALNGNSTYIQKLVRHLEEHPVIEGYCYVPLHVAILVHIFLTMKGALPTTLHELFCKFVLCSIARELETRESKHFGSRSNSLDDLPDELKFKLCNLTFLAYEGVMLDKAVFYEEDLQKFQLPANLPSLGLLQVVEGLTLLSKSLSYNFLHLSVQELLAAYHISHMDSIEQLYVFKQMFGGSRFQAVLHYFSGFTRLANPAIQDFISTYSRQKSSIEDILPLLHCFYEAQEPSLCNLLNFQVIILESLLNPVDYLAIGYYITSLLSVPSSDTSNVQLKIAGEIDDHRLKLLLLELSKYQTISASAARLEIEIVFSETATNIIENTRLIASFLEESSAVSKLMIQHKDRKRASEVFLSFAKALQSNSYLTTLTFMYEGPAYEHTCEEDYQIVKNMFEINNSLTQFSLSGRGGFACCIFQGLQLNKKLTRLNLRGARLVATEDIGQALTTMLQVNKTLTHLDLSHNSNLSVQGAYCVFQGLQLNNTLVYLNLSHTGLQMTKSTAWILDTMLKVNNTLTHLDLSHNNFLDQGAYCLFQGLQHNNTLVDLNLSHTGLEMTKNTARVLATMLRVNNTLTHLDLSNNFTLLVSGTWFIFVSLQCNTALVQLNLSDTGLVVTEDTTQALTTMLQVNKTLTHLDLSNNWKFQNASCTNFQGLQNTLVYLNLSNIQLVVKKDTPLAKALTTMLQKNKHLKQLDLSYNPLYDEGVYCLCEGLQHNTTLVYLNLSDSGITDKGAKCIARAYSSNRSLQLDLDVSNNHIRDYKTLEDSWRNHTLKVINQNLLSHCAAVPVTFSLA